MRRRRRASSSKRGSSRQRASACAPASGSRWATTAPPPSARASAATPAARAPSTPSKPRPARSSVRGPGPPGRPGDGGRVGPKEFRAVLPFAQRSVADQRQRWRLYKRCARPLRNGRPPLSEHAEFFAATPAQRAAADGAEWITAPLVLASDWCRAPRPRPPESALSPASLRERPCGGPPSPERPGQAAQRRPRCARRTPHRRGRSALVPRAPRAGPLRAPRVARRAAVGPRRRRRRRRRDGRAALRRGAAECDVLLRRRFAKGSADGRRRARRPAPPRRGAPLVRPRRRRTEWRAIRRPRPLARGIARADERARRSGGHGRRGARLWRPAPRRRSRQPHVLRAGRFGLFRARRRRRLRRRDRGQLRLGPRRRRDARAHGVRALQGRRSGRIAGEPRPLVPAHGRRARQGLRHVLPLRRPRRHRPRRQAQLRARGLVRYAGAPASAEAPWEDIASAAFQVPKN
ncbi:hypothetical protein M885DRAFT_100988 [Pelagophyceae sp. CCMP2097]|nr:hypothetical protein M885DRAFT_100988 [Pelagophyceae sp. CCMP2097]